MGKTSATIKLIQVLASRNDYVKTNELAEIIETNPRNIKEYIKEIEECGYTIESQLGLYGGYRLKKSSMLPALKLTVDDKKLLRGLGDYLENKGDFLDSNEAKLLLGRLLASTESENTVTPLTMIDRFPLTMPKEDLQKRYGALSDAIESQSKVSVLYTSGKGVAKEHTIHPYKMFVYNGTWFVLAFNESVGEIGYFKLNRIEEFFVTRNHFTILKTYSESDYLDGFGMKKNGEYHHIVLEFTGLNVAMSERIYGKNQKIEEIDNEHIKFECDMQNKDMIKSFVLSFGANCKIVEPEWLKDDVLETLTQMIDKL